MRMNTAIHDTPLRKIRKQLGRTLGEVARAVESDPGNLSRIERGVQPAMPDMAEKLAAYFGGQLTELEILYPERYMAAHARRDGDQHQSERVA